MNRIRRLLFVVLLTACSASDDRFRRLTSEEDEAVLACIDANYQNYLGSSASVSDDKAPLDEALTRCEEAVAILEDAKLQGSDLYTDLTTQVSKLSAFEKGIDDGTVTRDAALAFDAAAIEWSAGALLHLRALPD